MAKGQQKSNREKRKPKADKSKPAAASPFGQTPAKLNVGMGKKAAKIRFHSLFHEVQ